ncbi:arylamine N-acetyltransferase 1 [Wilcoxina mikolae CBS 423.85]|nr:arylamine N-acetyltransferase 1 [Wilcoxina mikolae CBS 423.85]
MDLLTPAQLTSYLTHLHLPSSPSPTLQQLMTAHLRYIPFESLSLHYSPTPTPTINISLDALFNKIITPRNRGGYCMENNTLFYALLRTLGFTVWPTGARVSTAVDSGGKDRSGRFLGWNHMVLIVEEEEERWAVDVGFGGKGPISPLPLVAEKITQGIGPEQYRLHFAPLKQMQNQVLKYWILQWRESDGKEWGDLYTFSTEVEFSREDYEVMNLATSTISVFVGLVCCVRNILGDEIADSEAGVQTTVGKMLLNGGTVKRRIGGKTEVMQVCKSECERVEALETWFGIVLTKKEREGIRKRPTEIKKEGESTVVSKGAPALWFSSTSDTTGRLNGLE